MKALKFMYIEMEVEIFMLIHVYIHSRDICLKGFSLFSRIYFLAETAFTTAIVSKDISLQF